MLNRTRTTPPVGHPKIVPPELGQRGDWFGTAHDFSLGHVTPTPTPWSQLHTALGPSSQQEGNRTVSNNSELHGYCIHRSAVLCLRTKVQRQKAEANKTDQLESVHPISQRDMPSKGRYQQIATHLTHVFEIFTLTFCIGAHRNMQPSRALLTFRSAR